MSEAAYSPVILEALKQDILASLHCALPGIVESFDAETQTVSVRPALRSRAGSDAGSNIAPMPLLKDVPVFLPGPKAATASWEISPGDECLLIFADACIDGWFETGSATLPPSGRRHDLSDAFAFVGFRSQPRAAAWNQGET